MYTLSDGGGSYDGAPERGCILRPNGSCQGLALVFVSTMTQSTRTCHMPHTEALSDCASIVVMFLCSKLRLSSQKSSCKLRQSRRKLLPSSCSGCFRAATPPLLSTAQRSNRVSLLLLLLPSFARLFIPHSACLRVESSTTLA